MKESDTKYCMIPFIENVQNKQIYRNRKLISVARGWQEKGGMTLNGYEVSFWHSENVLELGNDDG